MILFKLRILMKKFLFIILLFSAKAQSQSSIKFDRFFIEAGMGIGVPLSQQSPSGSANGSLSLIHVQGAIRYMFTQDLGVMGTMNFDSFEKSKDEKSDQKLIGLELVCNLRNVLGRSDDRTSFGLLAHGGVGGGAMSSKFNAHDYVGALTIGLKPIWSINEKVSLFADVAYKAILGQDIYYNGEKTNYPDPGQFTGSQLGFTFGIIAALGQNRTHADTMY